MLESWEGVGVTGVVISLIPDTLGLKSLIPDSVSNSLIPECVIFAVNLQHAIILHKSKALYEDFSIYIDCI